MRSFSALAIPFLCLLSLSTPTWSQSYPDTPPAGIRWGWQGYAQFKINSAAIRPQDRTLLLRVAEQMQRHPKVALLLTGHTDNTGNPDYNQRLSQRRNQAVADFIASHGVGLHRITQHGVGELRPVASNACDRDRRRNRRVDLAYFPLHRTPPQGGARVFSPSQPDPNDEAEACSDLPPPASRRASSSSASSSSGASSSASGPSSAASATASGASSAAGRDAGSASRAGSAGASGSQPAAAGSASTTRHSSSSGLASPWINPDDPAATPTTSSATSASSTAAPADSDQPGSSHSGGGPGFGGAPYEPEPLPAGVEF